MNESDMPDEIFARRSPAEELAVRYTSPQPRPVLKELPKSLAAAQIAMMAARFDSANPHFRSKYASLTAVNEVARELARNGIAYTQDVEEDEGRMRVLTTLWHSSGESLTGRSPWFRPAKSDAHGIAGCLTYCRRLGLSTFVVISGDEDDDGNEAAGRPGAPIRADGPNDRPPPAGGTGAPARATLDAGTQAAANGMEAYTAFWTALDREEKGLLAMHPAHEANKATAAKADATREAVLAKAGKKSGGENAAS